MLQHRSPAKDAVNGINLLMEKLGRSFFSSATSLSLIRLCFILLSESLFFSGSFRIRWIINWVHGRMRKISSSPSSTPPTRRLLPRRMNVINDFSLWVELEKKASWNKWNCCAVTRRWFMSTKRRNELFFLLDVTNYKNTLAVFSLRIFMVRSFSWSTWNMLSSA